MSINLEDAVFHPATVCLQFRQDVVQSRWGPITILIITAVPSEISPPPRGSLSGLAVPGLGGGTAACSTGASQQPDLFGFNVVGIVGPNVGLSNLGGGNAAAKCLDFNLRATSVGSVAAISAQQCRVGQCRVGQLWARGIRLTPGPDGPLAISVGNAGSRQFRFGEYGC